MAKKQDDLLPADDTAEAAPTDDAAAPAAAAPAKVRVVARDQLRVRVGAQDGRPVVKIVAPGEEILLDREEAERLIVCGAASELQKRKRGRS